MPELIEVQVQFTEQEIDKLGIKNPQDAQEASKTIREKLGLYEVNSGVEQPGSSSVS